MSRTTPRGAEARAAPAGRLRPFEKFLHIEASSGVMLLAAALAALALANSPWAATYHGLWHTALTLGVGDVLVTRSLHFWINDGLMTIFFLVVGLEIRRELHEGALADLRHAALPAAAAAGGIAVPALIFLALNRAPELSIGWAIPTATDIAFAVGILALLGRRVPMQLRVLLLALAIIDDIAAILVIALFYSDGIALSGLVVAGAGIAVVFLFQRLGFRTAWPYVIPGTIIWLGMLHAGVHPSISGVLCGMLTPVTQAFAQDNPLGRAALALERVRENLRLGTQDPQALLPPVRELREAQLDMLSPVVRVQAALHPWVAFGIMPLFALANAGVSLVGGGAALDSAADRSVFAGVVAGLVIGKPLGVMLATALALRLGLCALPEGVSWRGITLVALLSGIGFTMSIFIANLAFVEGELLAVATLAVLTGSALAGVAGLAFGRLALTPAAPAPAEAVPAIDPSARSAP